jgi:hypothetical protein
MGVLSTLGTYEDVPFAVRFLSNTGSETFLFGMVIRASCTDHLLCPVSLRLRQIG